ncbi:MAG: hypothetical protein ACR2MD_06905 [Aridibacter sp.]
MKKQTKSDWRKLLFTGITVLVFIFAASSITFSQNANFKAGDRVEADINMSSSPENAKWEKVTIVEVMIWQGKISGIYVKTDDGRNFTLGERHLRPLGETAKKTKDKDNGNNTRKNPTDKTKRNENNEQKKQAEFKVGDRVEVDSIMASDPKDSTWKKATVKAFEPENQRYIVMLDDFNEMSVLIRPGKIWSRSLIDGSKTPEYATCEFYKNYQKVSNTAPPSAALFKAVIFEWFNSINKYSDFGLVFEDFKMGKSFKNRALGNGRKDVHPASVGATIYTLKTKLIFCEKDVESTYRTEWTNEYSCYKNKVGEWTCKNAAPQNYKRTSFPNQ